MDGSAESVVKGCKRSCSEGEIHHVTMIRETIFVLCYVVWALKQTQEILGNYGVIKTKPCFWCDDIGCIV